MRPNTENTEVIEKVALAKAETETKSLMGAVRFSANILEKTSQNKWTGWEN